MKEIGMSILEKTDTVIYTHQLIKWNWTTFGLYFEVF